MRYYQTIVSTDGILVDDYSNEEFGFYRSLKKNGNIKRR